MLLMSHCFSGLLVATARCGHIPWHDIDEQSTVARCTAHYPRLLIRHFRVRYFVECLQSNALIHCRYPVILSIEDNCPVDGQRVIAQEITKILGEYLLKTKVSSSETAMPSPNQLRRKIIVKHKKLMYDRDAQGLGTSSEESMLKMIERHANYSLCSGRSRRDGSECGREETRTYVDVERKTMGAAYLYIVLVVAQVDG